MLLAVLALMSFSAAMPAAAGASSVEGGNAFNELSEKASEEAETTNKAATTKTGESEPRNSNKTIFIGIGAAVVLLLAIGYVIVRDARRVAPAGPDDVGEGKRGRDPAVRHANRRAKSKAARQARRKNR